MRYDACIHHGGVVKAFLLMVLALSVGTAFAQHRCKDNQGRTTFQDKPCEQDMGGSDAAKSGGQRSKSLAIGSPEHISSVAAELEHQLGGKLASGAVKPRPQLIERQKSNAESDSKPMDFEVCVTAADRMALQIGLVGRSAPIIVRTRDVLIRRMCTDDGSVIVTCSRADGAMTTTASPHGSRSEGCF